jgi:hypothetical protein
MSAMRRAKVVVDLLLGPLAGVRHAAFEIAGESLTTASWSRS